MLEERHRIPQLCDTKTVFTIHNIEYQGRYGDQVLEDVVGLGRNYSTRGCWATKRDVNLMKGAIMASTFVTTVSPTYAQELRLPFYAHGMAGVINQQSGKLHGILNGIDTQLYDPCRHPGWPPTSAPRPCRWGKKNCKAGPAADAGLRENPDAPIIACVSRLVRHKGFDLVTAAIHEIMAMTYR